MVRLVGCLLLLVVGLRGNAQLWNKTYIEDRPVMYFSSVVHDEGEYYIAGGARDKSGLNFTRAMLGRINGTGSLVSYKTVIDSATKHYGAFYNALIKDNKQQLCYAGYSYDSIPKLLFLVQNSVSDSIIVFEYATPNTYAFQGFSLIQHADNYYYISGIRTTASTNDGNMVLVKIDSAGNRLWEKYYGVTGKLEAAQSITVLRNGNLLLGGARDNRNQGNTLLNTWLIEVDTGGVVVRQWYDPNDSTYSAEGLKQTQDNGFIYGAQKKFLQTVNSIYFIGSIVKLDSNFNKEWIFTDGHYNTETGIYDVEELPDGSFIGCGNKPSGDSAIISGWIVKLSSTGEVIWNRMYKGLSGQSSKNFLTDIDVLPDGSLIAVGQCQYPGHTPLQVGWFLKLDSNGCEIENCTVGIEPTPKSPSRNNRDEKGDLNSRIQVWPNPFATDLSIALTSGYTNTATYTITNITGQIVYQQQESNLAIGYTKMLDLSYLPNGVYFVEVSTAAGKAVQRVVKE